MANFIGHRMWIYYTYRNFRIDGDFSLHQIEIIINIWLQGLGQWLLIPMQVISFFGTQYFLILILAWIYWCMDNQVGIRLGIALIIGNGFNTALKWIFHSPRPYWVNPSVKALGTEKSFGLPSGHSMISTIFYGRISAWIHKRWVTIIFIVIILLIGISRVYLGVHFFSDVIAGYCFGILLLLIFPYLEKGMGNWIKNKSFGLQIVFFFISSVLFILFFSILQLGLITWQIPEQWLTNVNNIGLESSIDPFRIIEIYMLAGLWFGMLSGYVWMNNSGGFQSIGKIEHKLIRFLLGIAGIGILTGLFELIGKQLSKVILFPIITFIQYFSISIWITACAPMIFVRIGLAKKD